MASTITLVESTTPSRNLIPAHMAVDRRLAALLLLVLCAVVRVHARPGFSPNVVRCVVPDVY